MSTWIHMNCIIKSPIPIDMPLHFGKELPLLDDERPTYDLYKKDKEAWLAETDRIMNADDEFVPIKDASVALIDRIWAFYEAAGLLDDEAKGILSYQKDKLVTPGRRYAERVYDEYKDDFFARGLKTSQNLP